jgi:Ca2+-binding EF-hand superfamily protein
LFSHKYCDLRKIFDLMDVDKKGFLDLRDIFDFMKSEDERVSYSDCERTLRKLDLNGDKRVDFREFTVVMRPVNISNAMERSERTNNANVFAQD